MSHGFTCWKAQEGLWGLVGYASLSRAPHRTQRPVIRAFRGCPAPQTTAAPRRSATARAGLQHRKRPSSLQDQWLAWALAIMTVMRVGFLGSMRSARPRGPSSAAPGRGWGRRPRPPPFLPTPLRHFIQSAQPGLPAQNVRRETPLTFKPHIMCKTTHFTLCTTSTTPHPGMYHPFTLHILLFLYVMHNSPPAACGA